MHAALIGTLMAAVSGTPAPPSCEAVVANPVLTVVFDNRALAAETTAGWGFACLVEGAPTRILFDTGAEGAVLTANMKALGIDPGSIGAVFISHAHGDHTGGLAAVLERNPHVNVFVPASSARELSAPHLTRLVPIRGAASILPGVCSLGEMGEVIREQSLVVNTERGLVIVTGCAHPGIVSIVERARAEMRREILLILGGFHLVNASTEEARRIAGRLRELGVRHVAPCHCTGPARSVFAEVFGARFIETGAGTVVRVADLD
jgi:7,8-dihydropterin-6-yl-methyl-4-(beta-D-ribofuranosyl)aminobenzene 5'-phosphate synthase